MQSSFTELKTDEKPIEELKLLVQSKLTTSILSSELMKNALTIFQQKGMKDRVLSVLKQKSLAVSIIPNDFKKEAKNHFNELNEKFKSIVSPPGSGFLLITSPAICYSSIYIPTMHINLDLKGYTVGLLLDLSFTNRPLNEYLIEDQQNDSMTRGQQARYDDRHIGFPLISIVGILITLRKDLTLCADRLGALYVKHVLAAACLKEYPEFAKLWQGIPIYFHDPYTRAVPLADINKPEIIGLKEYSLEQQVKDVQEGYRRDSSTLSNGWIKRLEKFVEPEAYSPCIRLTLARERKEDIHFHVLSAAKEEWPAFKFTDLESQVLESYKDNISDYRRAPNQQAFFSQLITPQKIKLLMDDTIFDDFVRWHLEDKWQQPLLDMINDEKVSLQIRGFFLCHLVDERNPHYKSYREMIRWIFRRIKNTDVFTITEVDGNGLLHKLMKHDVPDEALIQQLFSKTYCICNMNKERKTPFDIAIEKDTTDHINILDILITNCLERVNSDTINKILNYALIKSLDNIVDKIISLEPDNLFIADDTLSFLLTQPQQQEKIVALFSLNPQNTQIIKLALKQQDKTLFNELMNIRSSLNGVFYELIIEKEYELAWHLLQAKPALCINSLRAVEAMKLIMREEKTLTTAKQNDFIKKMIESEIILDSQSLNFFVTHNQFAPLIEDLLNHGLYKIKFHILFDLIRILLENGQYNIVYSVLNRKPKVIQGNQKKLLFAAFSSIDEKTEYKSIKKVMDKIIYFDDSYNAVHRSEILTCLTEMSQKNFDAIEFFLKHDPAVIFVSPWAEEMLYIVALKNQALALLLFRQASLEIKEKMINFHDSNGDTVLHAILVGDKLSQENSDLLDALLDAGAAFDKRNKLGNFPFTLLLKGKKYDFIDSLLEKYPQKFFAQQKGDILTSFMEDKECKRCEKFLETNKDYKDKTVFTKMMQVAYSHSPHPVESFITRWVTEGEVDPAYEDKMTSQSLLSLAIKYHDINLIEIYLTEDCYYSSFAIFQVKRAIIDLELMQYRDALRRILKSIIDRVSAGKDHDISLFKQLFDYFLENTDRIETGMCIEGPACQHLTQIQICSAYSTFLKYDNNDCYVPWIKAILKNKPEMEFLDQISSDWREKVITQLLHEDYKNISLLKYLSTPAAIEEFKIDDEEKRAFRIKPKYVLVKRGRIQVKDMLVSLINEAKEIATVMAIVSELESKQNDKALAFLRKRENLSLQGYQWNGEKVSGSFVYIMETAQVRVLQLASQSRTLVFQQFVKDFLMKPTTYGDHFFSTRETMVEEYEMYCRTWKEARENIVKKYFS